jgi:hypothetical protein
VNNSSSNSPNPNQSSKEVPGTVGGFKINVETGRINNEAWKQMPEKDKLKYFEAKTKLRNEGVIFPGDTQPSNSNETANEEFTKSDAFKNQQRTIHKLQQALKEKEDSSVNTGGEDKSNSNANISTMTFADVLKKMPKESAAKTTEYVQSKMSTMRRNKCTRTSDSR